jgi:putative endonuclease
MGTRREGGAPENKRRRRERERQGRRAENLAALWLQLKGYRILARRARTPGGEIDLIARRGKTLAFIEVKARARRAGDFEAAPPDAHRRIEASARVWGAGRRGADQLNWRFDVIAIVPGQLPHHLRDAWRPPA